MKGDNWVKKRTKRDRGTKGVEERKESGTGKEMQEERKEGLEKGQKDRKATRGRQSKAKFEKDRKEW